MGSALDKLRADGAGEGELTAFAHRLAQLEDPHAGAMDGADLEAVDDPPHLDDLGDGDAPGVAVVRLNGGLGTSMGLLGPKSLLAAKPGLSFLDVIVRQTRDVPLALMNSFATEAATAAAVPPQTRTFRQGREPKLRADTHEPVDWPPDPSLEWCPPGHGDVFRALLDSGVAGQLVAEGRPWALLANADNLGAGVDRRVAAWAERERTPLVMEVVRGTSADRKGGHLALLDGRLVLRETAQVPAGDPSFTDVARWRFYNTNNLWVDLRALIAAGPPPLPLIVNRKTVDPSDPGSPAVLQLETAMGAAVGAIAGARIVEVPRARFVPVKTTDDLMVLRSDAYAIGPDGAVVPRFAGAPPDVRLDRAFFTSVEQLEARTPQGVPSLRGCRSLTVRGDVAFGRGVEVRGDVELVGPTTVAAGTVLGS